MITYVLKEGVLNDDELFIPDEGKIFSGGYIAILEYWTFASTNHNNKNIKRFKNQSTLDKYLSKNYPDFEY